MNSDPHLSPLMSRCERLYKFTILTPHTFLPPDHPESLEDDQAEKFAQYLCDRVSTLLGARSYTPHRSGEAFLNMRFDDFEERFLRHSEYVIFITSGKNAASLDLIYPRMLVFLTIRPTWRSRGIVVYLGPPEGQEVFDPNLFLIKPLVFPLVCEEWESSESPWDTLLGRLQTQIPLTPELQRPKQLVEHLPIKSAKNTTNKNAAASALQPRSQSSTQTTKPNQNKYAKNGEPAAKDSINFSERSASIHPFAPLFSSSFKTSYAPLHQLESRYSIQRSFSLGDMCFCARRHHKKSTSKKSQQRPNSEPGLPIKSRKDLRSIFTPLRSRKKKQKEKETQTLIVVKTPEVIRAVTTKHDISENQKKHLKVHCLQVQVSDENFERRSTPHSITSTSLSKRRTHILSNGKENGTRCDSGIVSNYSLVSTEISTSSPNLPLYQHIQQQQTTTASPHSLLSSSSSSPSYINRNLSRWIQPKKRKSSPEVSSLRTDSSIEEQRRNEVEEFVRFVDDENDASVTILSDKSGLCEAGPFMKPGIPPLKKWTFDEEGLVPMKVEPSLSSLVVRSDSKNSADTVDDPTQYEQYNSELTYNSDHQGNMISCQKEIDNFENLIRPLVVQSEERIPDQTRNKSVDSFHLKVSSTNEENLSHESDLFISESLHVQGPMISTDSVGSFGCQSVSSSTETMVSGKHYLQKQYNSLVESQNVVSGDSSKSHGAEGSKCNCTSFSENERSSSLLISSKTSSNDPGLLTQSSTIEESVEMSVNASVQGGSFQPVMPKIHEAVLRQPLVQSDKDDSSESEDSITRQNQNGIGITTRSKGDPIMTKAKEERLLATDSPLNAILKTTTSLKAPNDSDLVSIRSPDDVSLPGGTDPLSLTFSEESASITNSCRKLSAVVEKSCETGGHEGIVFAAVMIDDNSMTLEEPHQDMLPSILKSDLFIMEKSTDSGIQSAVSTLQKSMKSTSLSVTDDSDQFSNASERLPTGLNELLDQEASERESIAQKSQDIPTILPIIGPVQSTPLSAAVYIPQVFEEFSSENAFNYQFQNEPDAATRPTMIQTVQKQQKCTEKLQESVQKLQQECKIPDVEDFSKIDNDQVVIQRGKAYTSSMPSWVQSDPSDDSIEEIVECEHGIDKKLLPPGERRSILVDNADAIQIFDKEAYEIVRDMLRNCSPETLLIVHNAVKTYDKLPNFIESAEMNQESLIPEISVMSTTEDVQLSSAMVHQPTFLWKIIPKVSVALINLSTAYIPRYINTIYDYSMALIRPERPDRNLRELTVTVQEAFLNHPLGTPILLAGTALLSPWAMRQFPLTFMAICQGTPNILRRLVENSGDFFAEHFADITEVFRTSPTLSAFAIVGSRGVRWPLSPPT